MQELRRFGLESARELCSSEAWFLLEQAIRYSDDATNDPREKKRLEELKAWQDGVEARGWNRTLMQIMTDATGKRPSARLLQKMSQQPKPAKKKPAKKKP
jgi:hypothetical protein